MQRPPRTRAATASRRSPLRRRHCAVLRMLRESWPRSLGPGRPCRWPRTRLRLPTSLGRATVRWPSASRRSLFRSAQRLSGRAPRRPRQHAPHGRPACGRRLGASAGSDCWPRRGRSSRQRRELRLCRRAATCLRLRRPLTSRPTSATSRWPARPRGTRSCTSSALSSLVPAMPATGPGARASRMPSPTMPSGPQRAPPSPRAWSSRRRTCLASCA
mmetsp:Transcript_111975/g.154646  ORF Transcript_111975/g.154646 Transcript_111975/m.154646 type:complete len:216 (-) Transcript_111975:584-1231(-)